VTGDLLTGAIRLDLAHSSPEAANDIPTVSGTGASAYTVAPKTLWQRYYGGGQDIAPTDITLSGKLRYDHPLNRTAGLYAEAGRMVRIPEAGERFYASGGPSSLVQVGNPGLKPEEHHRAEIGGEYATTDWQGYFAPNSRSGSGRITTSGWYDRVSDFITVDRARGQTGILKSDQAIIYRNVDAYLAGASATAWWQMTDRMGARARVVWSQGGNLTDGRPLYQIPPLEGDLVIEHRQAVWDVGRGGIGLRLGFSASQRQVDAANQTGSGEDTGGKTPGFAVLDLFTNLTLENGLGFSAGIANLLDKRYHQHLNPFPQSPTTQVQRAPGRSLFVMASLAF
jgi:iron complex outermembrane receptor protein